MAAPKGGCFGKILDIDLTTGKISTVTYDDETARKYLGGKNPYERSEERRVGKECRSRGSAYH